MLALGEDYINNGHNFSRDILLQVLRQARAYNLAGLKVVALNPYEPPPSWFTRGAEKWAKAPLKLYAWKKNSYSFIDTAKRLRQHYEATGKVPNIGIRGYAVIDFDKISLKEIKNIKDKHVKKLILNTRLVRTASGGIHAYFDVDEKVHTEHYAGERGGIDFISQDEYVVAPPSTIAGRQYTFLNNHDPLKLSRAEWEALRDYLVQSFNLKRISDSGAQLSEAKVVEEYITLKNGYKIPRVSYADTVAVYNAIFKRKVKLRPKRVPIPCPLYSHTDRHNNGDEDYSATIYEADSGHGLFYCHKCGYYADIYYILRKLLNLDFLSSVNFINDVLDEKKYRVIPPGGEMQAIHKQRDKHASQDKLDLEKVTKAFNRKGSKLKNVYEFLITIADDDGLVAISTPVLAEQLHLGSHISALKYLKRLQRLQLLKLVTPGRQHTPHTYQIKRLPERIYKEKKVTADASKSDTHQDYNTTYHPHLSICNTISKTNDRRAPEKVTSEPIYIGREVEYCTIVFLKDVPAIVGVDERVYPEHDDIFRAEHSYRLPVPNACIFEQHGEGYIIKYHGVEKCEPTPSVELPLEIAKREVEALYAF